jgi:hypothetical protein
VKFVSLALLGVLTALHLVAGGDAAGLPLSMFRDGNHAGLGYLAFALLIAMGVMMTRASFRSGESINGAFYAAAMTLLAMIAVTPSFDLLHLFLSLLLPLAVYVYYAFLFYSAATLWMLLHLSIPIVLAVATGFHSYGAWQKCLILYFVLLANLHWRFLPTTTKPKQGKPARRGDRWEEVEEIMRNLENRRWRARSVSSGMGAGAEALRRR